MLTAYRRAADLPAARATRPVVRGAPAATRLTVWPDRRPTAVCCGGRRRYRPGRRGRDRAPSRATGRRDQQQRL